MDITVGLLFLATFCVWCGLMLGNVRRIRKAAERTATAAEATAKDADYQSRLAYRRATQPTT